MNKKRIQQIKCLFTLFFVVCASFYATRSYAQNNAVTIRLSGVSMERVMNEIENQTNYLFLSNKDVDINSVVSVDVEARLPQAGDGERFSEVPVADCLVLAEHTAKRRFRNNDG